MRIAVDVNYTNRFISSEKVNICSSRSRVLNELSFFLLDSTKNRENLPLFLLRIISEEHEIETVLSVLCLALHNLKDRQLFHSAVWDHQRMLMGISPFFS